MAELIAQSPANELEVVLAIPGRVRIRAFNKGLEAALERLAQHLRKQKGICFVNVSFQTKSLLVTFDEKQLSLQQLLQQLHQYGVATEEKLPPTEPQTELWAPVSAAIETVQLDSMIPLMVGMSLVQRLGIYGLPAIPLYLIAAYTTRQVIDQLEPEWPIFKAFQGTEEPESSCADRVVYSVVHSVAGRMRFRVPRVTNDAVYSRRLERLMQSAEGVTSVRINGAAQSVTVCYEARAVSQEAMRERLIALIEQASHTGDTLTRGNIAPLPPGTLALSPPCSPAPPPRLAEIPQQQTAAPVAVKERARALRAIATQEKTAAKKPTMWDEYKPPALSMFLAFMANLC